MERLFEKYKGDIEKSLNVWMKNNGYKEVVLEGKVKEDLLDEVLCFLCSDGDMGFVMDEIDSCDMLGEYDWCEYEEEDC